jgi:hypothetical protein
MARFVRAQKPGTGMNVEKSIIESSGAKEIILSSKGNATIKSSKIRAHPIKVYNALVSILDSYGLGGKKEVTTNHKNEIYVSERGCDTIKGCYQPKN